MKHPTVQEQCLCRTVSGKCLKVLSACVLCPNLGSDTFDRHGNWREVGLPGKTLKQIAERLIGRRTARMSRENHGVLWQYTTLGLKAVIYKIARFWE